METKQENKSAAPLPVFYNSEAVSSRLTELYAYLENFPDGCMAEYVKKEAEYLEAVIQQNG